MVVFYSRFSSIKSDLPAKVVSIKGCLLSHNVARKIWDKPIDIIYLVLFVNMKQAGTELGQAQLKLRLDCTSIKI